MQFAQILRKNNAPDTQERPPTDWSAVMVRVLRALAVWSMGHALWNWLVIFGVMNGAPLPFEDMPFFFQAMTTFYAVVFVIAGVGLWLTAAWGGAAWLLAVFVSLFIDAMAITGASEVVTHSARTLIVPAVDLAFVALYIFVTAKAVIQHRSG